MSVRRKTVSFFLPAALGVALVVAAADLMVFRHQLASTGAAAPKAGSRLPRPPVSVGGDEERAARQRDESTADVGRLTSAQLAERFRRLMDSEDGFSPSETMRRIMQILAERGDSAIAYELLAAWSAAHPRVPVPASTPRYGFGPRNPSPSEEEATAFYSIDDPYRSNSLFHEFFRLYHPAASVLLADLQRFPDLWDKREILSIYATSISSVSDGGPERARALLAASRDATDGEPRLTPSERDVIVRAVGDNLKLGIHNLSSADGEDPPPDLLRDHLGGNLRTIGELAPLLDPLEQSQLRGAVVEGSVRILPYFAWGVAAPGAAVPPETTASMIGRMMDTGQDQALEALSSASASQSDMIAAVFTSTRPADPFDPANNGAPADAVSTEPYFAPEQANPIAVALFNAAIAHNDPERARQWLGRITDPAAHAEAEKKLPPQ